MPQLAPGPRVTGESSGARPGSRAVRAGLRYLKRLYDITRVPRAVYLREALDDLLKKYPSTLRKAAK